MIVPDRILEISRNMNASPVRATANPFWEVRHKDYLVTSEGYNDHHFELVGDDGAFYRSDKPDAENAVEFIVDFAEEWFEKVVSEAEENGMFFVNSSEILSFIINKNEFPEGINKVFVQQVKKTVWTGLSEFGANAFIKRKQHDYPKLYTYVESAYWSPELIEVMDFISGFSKGEEVKKNSREWLIANGLTGLFYPGECACSLDSHYVCKEDCSLCTPGYRHEYAGNNPLVNIDYCVTDSKEPPTEEEWEEIY